MEIYLKLFEVVFPVFFIVGIGYYLGKKDKKFDTTFITNFASNIGTPAMVIYAITSTGINFQIFKDYFFFYLLAILGFIILGIIILFMLIILKFEALREKQPPTWEKTQQRP